MKNVHSFVGGSLVEMYFFTDEVKPCKHAIHSCNEYDEEGFVLPVALAIPSESGNVFACFQCALEAAKTASADRLPAHKIA